jgi:hypothetical protein
LGGALQSNQKAKPAPKSQPFFFAFLFTWDYALKRMNLGEVASKQSKS